jgi:putative membrane protein
LHPRDAWKDGHAEAQSSQRTKGMDDSAKDPRVYLAAERTFLAWIRTGLALMGFGFVVARFGLFLRALSVNAQVVAQTPHFSVWIGTVLVLIGVAVNLLAALHHVRLVRELNRGITSFDRPSRLAISVALVLAVVGVAMAVYLAFVR